MRRKLESEEEEESLRIRQNRDPLELDLWLWTESWISFSALRHFQQLRMLP
jgi:hypothetical protein